MTDRHITLRIGIIKNRQVPGFTFPFNLVGWAVWSVLLRTESMVSWQVLTQFWNGRSSPFTDWIKIHIWSGFSQDPVQKEETISEEEVIAWSKLLWGSVYAMGQVRVIFLAIVSNTLVLVILSKTNSSFRCLVCSPSHVLCSASPESPSSRH